ncbi:MAG: WHG domain-containing protein [Noviherbaspirillum sp.]
MSRQRGEHGKPGQSLEQLVDAGLAILKEEGLSGLTLRKATVRAGLTQSAAYQLRTLARATDRATSEIRSIDVALGFRAAIAARGFEKLWLRLRRASSDGNTDPVLLAVAYVDFARRNPGLYRVMFDLELGKELEFGDFQRFRAECFEVLLTTVRASGVTDDAVTRTLALALLLHGLADESINGWIQTGSRHDLEALIQRHVALLLPRNFLQ